MIRWCLPAAACGLFVVACGSAEALAPPAPDSTPSPEAGAPLPPLEAGPPWIFVGQVLNARDLGGTVLSQAQRVSDGAVYRGPVLWGLDGAGCAEFARRGIRTIVDLREETERAATPDDPCVTAVADVVTAPLPIPYSVSPADYVRIVHTSESMAAAFRVLAEPESYPVYVHCTFGRDRTGVLVALLLTALGAPRDEVLREYTLSQPIVGAFPPSLEAALGEVESLGGIESYLASLGVGPAEVASLQDRLRVPRAPY